MPEIVHKQGTTLWHEARQGRITASTAAAILGLNPHMGPLAAYNYIMGITKPKDNGHVRFGMEMEERARRQYEMDTGNLVQPTGFWVHPDDGWLGASPDGLVGDDGLLEIKCPTTAPDSVPEYHRVQMAIQAYVTERIWCDYYAWTKPKVFYTRVQKGNAWVDVMLEQLHKFYVNHILTKTPPPRRRRKSDEERDSATGQDPDGQGHASSPGGSSGKDRRIQGEDGGDAGPSTPG